MELVTTTREPKNINPVIQIIYSVPKAGKTTVISYLEDHLIAECEPGGADYVTGRIQEINDAKEWIDFLELLDKTPGPIAEYLIVDSVTKVDEWSEIVGTYRYMKKPQGKGFNRINEKGKVKVLTADDDAFESVHEIGQGYGYRYSREVMFMWYDALMKLITDGKFKYIILLAHVKDKFVESRNGDTVEHIDIALTGKVKSILASRVDGIGHLRRENNKVYISYNNGEKIVSGGRCSHLTGDILLSEKLEDGTIKTYWEKIYKNK